MGRRQSTVVSSRVNVEPKDFSSITSRLRQSDDADPVTRSHLETLGAVIEAVEKGDLDTVFAHASGDVTFDIFAPMEFGWIRQARGAGQVRRAIEHNFSAVVDQRPVITSISSQGDTVVFFGREQGRIRATGASYDVEFVQRFTFAAGRIASIRILAAHAGTS